MTKGLRAFLGALVGALGVLFIHPGARPYMLDGFSGSAAGLRALPLLNESVDQLPEPRTQQIAAWWLLVGADRETTGRPLSDDERRLMVEVAQTGADQDPQNAFWWLGEAAFQKRLGNDEAARAAWRRAAAATRWNDLQGDRLRLVIAEAARRSGREMGWHYAVARTRRTEANARFAFEAVSPWLTAESSLNERVIGVQNGTLIRNGGRSVSASAYGVDLIRRALSAGSESPREAVERQGQMISELFAAGRREEAQAISQAVVDNEAWIAFVNQRAADERFRRLATEAVVAAAVPAGLLVAAAFGGLLWALGAVVGRWPPPAWMLHPILLSVVGVAAGVAVYWTLGIAFPAVWATIAMVVIAIVPDRTKEFAPVLLPRWFRGALSLVSLVLLAAVALGVLCLSGPSQALRGQTHLMTPAEGTGVGVGLAVVALGALLTGTVGWAYWRRFRFVDVLPLTLKWTGGVLTLVGLAACAVVTPIAVARDQAVIRPLAEIFRNEPTFYLVRSD